MLLLLLHIQKAPHWFHSTCSPVHITTLALGKQHEEDLTQILSIKVTFIVQTINQRKQRKLRVGTDGHAADPGCGVEEREQGKTFLNVFKDHEAGYSDREIKKL